MSILYIYNTNDSSVDRYLDGEIIQLVQEMHGRERLEFRIPANNCKSMDFLFDNNKIKSFIVRGKLECFDGFLASIQYNGMYWTLVFVGAYEYFKTKLHWSTSVDWGLFYSKSDHSYTLLDNITHTQDYINPVSYFTYEPVLPYQSSTVEVWVLQDGVWSLFTSINGIFTQTVNLPLRNDGFRLVHPAGTGFVQAGTPPIPPNTPNTIQYNLTRHYTTEHQINTLWMSVFTGLKLPGYTNGGSCVDIVYDDVIEFGDISVNWGASFADTLDEINENGYEWYLDGCELHIAKQIGKRCTRSITNRSSTLVDSLVYWDGTRTANYAHNNSDDAPLGYNLTTNPLFEGYTPTIPNGEAIGIAVDTDSQSILDTAVFDITGQREFNILLDPYKYSFCDISVGDEVRYVNNSCDRYLQIDDCFRVVRKEYGIATKLTLSKDVFLYKNRLSRQLRKLAINQ